jgi:hypothetical protein
MRRLTLVVILAASGLAAAHAQHLPVFPSGVVELQSRAQLVASIGSWNVLGEVLGKLHDTSTPLRGFESVTVGGYYRVIPYLKVGALARVQAGARHDQDLLADIPSNNFVWNDTSSRLEGVLMLDASPRFRLPFLPTGNWIFMLKNRFEYNTWNGQMSAMTRPELTWFWLRDRDPFLNLSLSWELYFPLNFGSSIIYENYPYVTALWHATTEVGIELSAAYKTTVWSTSDSWLAAAWGTYTAPQQSWVVSLGVVYTPSF